MAETLRADRIRQRTKLKPIWGWLIVLAGLAGLFWLGQVVSELDRFPDTWNIGLREILNDFKRWVVVNRNTHWIFVFLFEPFSAAVDFGLRRVEDFLLWLPWPMVVLLFFFLADRLSGLRLALLTSVCLIPMGLFGLWEESMQTLALMVMAVLFALALGIPLGIWSARNDRVDLVLRPILDAMQTLPAFVYLIPVLLFFGVARVPSIIATVIYALPPAIRLTNLGIRGVPAEVIEAAKSFGSTDRQLLRKVQIPVALPTIMVGVNQTIMMALSIVVIAALIGAGGLGDVVLKALRRLRVGSAVEAGLAIVFMAILLDRLSAALSQIERRSAPQYEGFRLFAEQRRGSRVVEAIEARIDRLYGDLDGLADWFAGLIGKLLGSQREWLSNHRDWIGILAVLAALSVLLRLLGIQAFPGLLRLDISGPVDALVRWMQINLYNIGGSGIGTGPVRDFLIIGVFQPLRELLVDRLPWTLVAFLFIAAAFAAGGWRLMLSVLGLTLIVGLLGMWPFAMDTLGQTIVAASLCILVGIPLGIWAAHNDRVDTFLRPILDFLQTIPIFVYLVPVIMLFGTGSVAGLIASVLYAVVPVVRLTSAGIRELDDTLYESARSFGSTAVQTLFKLEIPLAFPTIMLGINQTIMMVLAMVIIAGLVGATGLGLEVYQGFANDSLGRSVEAGLAIVLLAIVIDRITQELARKTATAVNIS